MTGPGANPPPKKPWEFVDEVRRDAEEKALAAAAPPPRRWRVPWMAPVLTVLVILNVLQWRRPHHTAAAFTSAEEDASARFGIYLAEQAVVHFRDSAGALPRDLAAAGVEGDGIEYAAAGSAFSLRVQVGARTIAYRSGEDLGPFAGAYSMLRLATQP